MHGPPFRNGFTRGLFLRFFDCSMSLLWLMAAMIPTAAAESRGFFLDGHRDTLATPWQLTKPQVRS